MGYLDRSTPGAVVLRNAGDVAVHAGAFGIVFWGLYLASELTHPAVALLPVLYAVGLPAEKARWFDYRAAMDSTVTSARRTLAGAVLKWAVGFPLSVLGVGAGGLVGLRWLLALPVTSEIPGASAVDLTWSWAAVPDLVTLVVVAAVLALFAGVVSLSVRVFLAVRETSG